MITSGEAPRQIHECLRCGHTEPVEKMENG